MSDLMKNFEQHIEQSSWEDVAKMVKSYSLEFSKEDREVRRFKKQTKLVKELLYEYLEGEQCNHIVKKATFFRGLVKSITLLETNIDKHAIKRTELLVLLKALLKRIQKEKLVVHKTMERRKGFEKLKEAGDE